MKKLLLLTLFGAVLMANEYIVPYSSPASYDDELLSKELINGSFHKALHQTTRSGRSPFSRYEGPDMRDRLQNAEGFHRIDAGMQNYNREWTLQAAWLPKHEVTDEGYLLINDAPVPQTYEYVNTIDIEKNHKGQTALQQYFQSVFDKYFVTARTLPLRVDDKINLHSLTITLYDENGEVKRFTKDADVVSYTDKGNPDLRYTYTYANQIATDGDKTYVMYQFSAGGMRDGEYPEYEKKSGFYVVEITKLGLGDELTPGVKVADQGLVDLELYVVDGEPVVVNDDELTKHNNGNYYENFYLNWNGKYLILQDGDKYHYMDKNKEVKDAADLPPKKQIEITARYVTRWDYYVPGKGFVRYSLKSRGIKNPIQKGAGHEPDITGTGVMYFTGSDKSNYDAPPFFLRTTDDFVTYRKNTGIKADGLKARVYYTGTHIYVLHNDMFDVYKLRDWKYYGTDEEEYVTMAQSIPRQDEMIAYYEQTGGKL